MFTGRRDIRRVKIDSRYSVDEDGVVWSGGLPLEPINGVGVNLHGKRVKICYLVARAFVGNPECRRYVRHRNGDRTDNRAVNLEWSDEEEKGKMGRKPAVRRIKAWKMDGDVAGMWDSVPEAREATGVSDRAIRDCLNGKQKSAGGLYWQDI